MKKKVFSLPSVRDWRRSVLAGGYYSGSYTYAYGYYRAAELLVGLTLGGETGNFLFFPICFNYRHYVELALKELILSTERLADLLHELGELKGQRLPSVSSELQKTHSLGQLLGWLADRLALVSDEAFSPDVRKLIIEIHSLDPHGVTFRYPFRQDGSLNLPDQKYYDIEILRRRMAEIHWHLSGIDGWLGHTEDIARGMREDFLSSFY